MRALEPCCWCNPSKRLVLLQAVIPHGLLKASLSTIAGCTHNPCHLPVSLLPRSQVRHNPDSGKLQWQNRPLTNELITCAAADVAYLIPLLETQVGPGPAWNPGLRPQPWHAQPCRVLHATHAEALATGWLLDA